MIWIKRHWINAIDWYGIDIDLSIIVEPRYQTASIFNSFFILRSNEHFFFYIFLFIVWYWFNNNKPLNIFLSFWKLFVRQYLQEEYFILFIFLISLAFSLFYFSKTQTSIWFWSLILEVCYFDKLPNFSISDIISQSLKITLSIASYLRWKFLVWNLRNEYWMF